MSKNELLKKVNEGMALLGQGTFNPTDLVNYLADIIEAETAAAAKERERLLKLLRMADDARRWQREAGKSSKARFEAKLAEVKLDKAITWLHSKGYNTSNVTTKLLLF